MRVLRFTLIYFFVFFLFFFFSLESTALVAGLFGRSPPSLNEELGLSPTLQKILQREDVYFDPFEIADDDNFAFLREAELKHGRVAMLASVGLILGPNQGRDVWELLQTYVFKEEFLQPGAVRDLLVKETTEGQQSYKTSWEVVNPVNFIQIVALCGFLETFVLVQLDPDDMPGDYGIGYFGVRDKGQNERSLVSELENGRLAMLASVAYFFLELNTGKSGTEQYLDYLMTVR